MIKTINGEYSQFTVASVSSNTNAFGLTGVILIARDGEAFEAAAPFGIAKGEVVALQVSNPAARGTNRYSWVSVQGRTFEIPRALPACPPTVLKEVFP